MTNQEAMKMPWDTKQTIENLKILKEHLQKAVIQKNFEGRGEQDAAEIAFDFDRAIAALEKQEPMEVAEIHCDEYYCPSCGSENMADCYKVGDNYCPRCGQALKTEEKDENSD